MQIDNYALNFQNMSPINATQTNTVPEPIIRKMKKGQVTAVLGVPLFKQEHTNSRRDAMTNSWRILLDSGSDGDILFRQRGTWEHQNGVHQHS